MNKHEARALIEKFIETEKAVWALAGVTDYIPHSGFDFIEGEWALWCMDEVRWVYGNEVHNASVQGSSIWKGEHYTIAVCHLKGAKTALIFDNEKHVDYLRSEEEDDQ